MTNLTNKPPRYYSYILRCWEEPTVAESEHGKRFRFSLEDPHSGERHGFANIEALTNFLRSNICQPSGNTAPDSS